MGNRDEKTALARILSALENKQERQLIAIVGPPASGKSTLAEKLVEMLGPEAILLPMDGFHLDNAVLEARGLRSRKGAPQTFAAEEFVAMVAKARQESSFSFPLFDRANDCVIAAAGQVKARHKLLIFEGNYLLLRDAPWRRLAAFWELSVWLNVPDEILHRRLMARWRTYGLSEAQAKQRCEENDLPNARYVIANSAPADLYIDVKE